MALNVSDLDRSVHFYRDLVGLQVERRLGNEVAFLRCGDDDHNLVLYGSPVPGIRRMAFELESENDLDNVARHVASLGWAIHEVPIQETRLLAQGRTLRFRVPDHTLTFELYATMGRAAQPYVPTVAKIQRLGHVVVRCRDRDAVLRTLTEQLNFRVSDHFGDQVAFLRCFPNPYHHSFGLSRADDDGLHHLNFMVTDVDDVGRAMNRMRNHDVRVVYGPGRHDISNSIFIYYLDPDGMTTEYSFGMEEFPEHDARAPRDLPMRAEILDAWGGAPAPGFGQTGSVDVAAV